MLSICSWGARLPQWMQRSMGGFAPTPRAQRSQRSPPRRPMTTPHREHARGLLAGSGRGAWRPSCWSPGIRHHAPKTGRSRSTRDGSSRFSAVLPAGRAQPRREHDLLRQPPSHRCCRWGDSWPTPPIRQRWTLLVCIDNLLAAELAVIGVEPLDSAATAHADHLR